MNKYKKVVLKIGSALISNEKNTKGHLINNICDQISKLSKDSVEFVIVTSGAISQGQKTLKITHKPEELDSLQALAAIGQQSLMRMYQGSDNHDANPSLQNETGHCLPSEAVRFP